MWLGLPDLLIWKVFYLFWLKLACYLFIIDKYRPSYLFHILEIHVENFDLSFCEMLIFYEMTYNLEQIEHLVKFEV